MTAYWPCLLAAVCTIAVLRCAARQRHGMRSLLARAVCGLGALALLGLLEPVTGIALPLNRFTGVLRGRFRIARRDGPADFAAGFYKILAEQGGSMLLLFYENEWNIRRRDSPQGLPEESPGFTETE